MTSGLEGAALVRDAVARALDPDDPFTRTDALITVRPSDVEKVLHARASVEGGTLLTVGVGASPGVASGIAVFDASRAIDRAEHQPVILVGATTGRADEAALAAVVGVVTTTGGIASHAAILARGRGLPAVCGADGLQVRGASCTSTDGRVVHEGDLVTIDGSTGAVSLGGVEPEPADVPAELDHLLAWADEVRAGSLAVWANADTPEDARRARAAGAEGIGLCRTEHLLLAGDRVGVLRRLVLAEGEAEQADAADELRTALAGDLEQLLEVMDGLPVVVRLLDLPLDELLDGASVPDLPPEHDPMLGIRGVRLLVLRPDLGRALVGALADAVRARRRAGGRPSARVLIPFVATASEVVLIRELIAATLDADALDAPGEASVDLPVGVMVETPRAALRCGELAGLVDFLSFGTNDLTQLTFAVGRDDAGGLVDRYLGGGLLPADPFRTIDVRGVGDLVALGIERARDADPSLEIGVCGEHAGDAASIAFFRSAGIDLVSCSPFRVPVARLAAARSVLSPDPEAG